MSRISKKLMPAFEDIEGAVMMVNAIDPQIETVKVFLEAVSDIPHFVVLNKVDAVSTIRCQEITEHFPSETVVWTSTMEKRGLSSIKANISKMPEGKIAVLGIFNSGKTSLINDLTETYELVSDLPGTTLVITPRVWNKWTLLDTVGQIIDVNKPLMVSMDFTGINNLNDKVYHALHEDEMAIRKSILVAQPSIVKAIRLINTQLQKGKKVVITGAGASALVAMEMAGQMQETGVPVLVFTNNFSSCQPVSFAKGIGEDELAIAAYTVLACEKGDVLIGISASGGTACIHDALRLARSKGVVTIAITENLDTPLGHNADLIIKSEAKPEGPSSSKIQITHLAIGHALVLCLAEERGINAEQSIQYMMPRKMPNKKMGIK